MMDRHGIQTELLKHEYGFDKDFQSKKNKKFMDELADKVESDKELPKDVLIDTAK